MGSLFVIVRDSGSFLGNPWPQNTSSEHPKNNPPPRLPPKWTPRCTFGLQDVPKMAQARPKAQKNIKNDVGNDPKATQSESLDKKHPDRRHRPQGLFNITHGVWWVVRPWWAGQGANKKWRPVYLNPVYLCSNNLLSSIKHSRTIRLGTEDVAVLAIDKQTTGKLVCRTTRTLMRAARYPI